MTKKDQAIQHDLQTVQNHIEKQVIKHPTPSWSAFGVPMQPRRLKHFHPHQKEQCKAGHDHHVGKIGQDKQHFGKQVDCFLLVGRRGRGGKWEAWTAGEGGQGRIGLRDDENRGKSGGANQATEEQRCIEVATDDVDVGKILSVATLIDGTDRTTKVDDGQDKVSSEGECPDIIIDS